MDRDLAAYLVSTVDAARQHGVVALGLKRPPAIDSSQVIPFKLLVPCS